MLFYSYHNKTWPLYMYSNNNYSNVLRCRQLRLQSHSQIPFSHLLDVVTLIAQYVWLLSGTTNLIHDYNRAVIRLEHSNSFPWFPLSPRDQIHFPCVCTVCGGGGGGGGGEGGSGHTTKPIYQSSVMPQYCLRYNRELENMHKRLLHYFVCIPIESLH